ncbi:MAG: ABC transporter permease [Firmicutes bacterium]|nr:ABC transporter permease [Bacillota bacterium]
MGFLQAFRLSVSAMFAKKLRSFLTMLGVIIGVFSVVALISLGQGATSLVTEQVQAIGSNLVIVNIIGRGARAGLSLEEAMALASRPGVSAIAPVLSGQATFKHQTQNVSASLEGVTPDYSAVRNHHIKYGRSLVAADLEHRQKVAILGSEVAQELFGEKPPLGAQIRINGNAFTVIGVLEEKGDGIGGTNDNKVLIPLTTAQRLLRNMNISALYIQAEAPESVDRVPVSVEASLNQIFRDEEAFRVFNQADLLDTVSQVTGTLTLMLGGIAAISLLVGGIGIMNIMLVSVTERTREIGICKALGARKKDILYQFLIESAVISGTGGLIGLMLGQLAASLVNRFSDFPTEVTFQVAVLALAFSVGVGIFFGIWPANKAADLSPVEALRAQ